MFDIEHLNRLRGYELTRIIGHFRPGASILELGAGTGAQALALSKHGFTVSAVDIPQSNYAEQRIFPVVDYDGHHLPFAAASFDIVYSSNVLEHVQDLAAIHAEIRRVLNPGGYCVHVLPSTSWRLWTTLSAFPDAVNVVRPQLGRLIPSRVSLQAIRQTGSVWRQCLRHLLRPLVPIPHGEVGNALTELWRFSSTHWQRHFDRHGFEIVTSKPMGLFYTGYMFYGTRFSLERRESLSHWLGSACNLFELRPKQNNR